MASPWTVSLLLFFSLRLLMVASGNIISITPNTETPKKRIQEVPKPTRWPEQFHSVLVMNNSKTHEVQVVDLWYDWPKGRNLNLIQYQLGKKLYDVEYDNHTSYYFTRDDNRECRMIHFDVGILTPNWLDGATYTGQEQVDGFLCNVWEKADFIRYYEDVVTKRPVQWIFYTGRAFHVMSFEVGAVLEDSEWQAPVYCFDKKEQVSELGQLHRILRHPLSLPSV